MPEVCPNGVLLVDDDPSVRTVLSQHIKRAGFETREAEDGIDGLVKLRNELPKVIISDIEMPRMSGFEFIGVVRRRFPFMPVIVLSGSIPNDVPEEAEPDVWFEKGALDIHELLRALRALVRKTPDRVDIPQVVTTPVRTRPGFAGHIILTCPDCLRTFAATSTPEHKVLEGTAVCIYCEARVPFRIESSAPE